MGSRLGLRNRVREVAPASIPNDILHKELANRAPRFLKLAKESARFLFAGTPPAAADAKFLKSTVSTSHGVLTRAKSKDRRVPNLRTVPNLSPRRAKPKPSPPVPNAGP